MCEMTSMGEISAARTTIPGIEEPEADGAPRGDLRRAFTTSFTPRLRVLFFAAAKLVSNFPCVKLKS